MQRTVAMTWDVTAIGTLNIDLLMVGQGPSDLNQLTNWAGAADMEMTAAGSVGYTACNLAKLGLNVTVSSGLSDDPLGAFVIESLRRDGVNTDYIHLHEDKIGGIGAYMLLFGNRKRPLVYRMPNHEFWPSQYSTNEIEALLDTRLLHVGGYLHFHDNWHGSTVDIFKEARRRRLITTLDPQFPLFELPPPWLPAMDDILPYVDVLFCDETEARSLTGSDDLDEAAVILLDAGATTVAIKQGEHGSTVYQGDHRIHQPALPHGEVIDTIGAGDAYNAAFILGTLEGWTLQRRTLFATVAAGFTVTGIGGCKQMRGREEIEAEIILRGLD
jgi:sugar/nucleoside kinase (ribokinase family)